MEPGPTLSRQQSAAEEASAGIVLAADVEELNQLEALSALAEATPEVVALKVGFSLALRYGLAAVTAAIRTITPLPVIYDHQKAGTDIPQMGPKLAAVCREAGVQGLILFPQAGPDALQSFVRAALETGLTPIVGLVMSHPRYLASEGGFITDTAPDRTCRLAVDAGVTDFVLPATRPDIVKRFVETDLAPLPKAKIFMPGIGSQGGSLSDAVSAASPKLARPIIGSAVYDSPTPGEALQTFVRMLPS